jgi:N4-gp56 family major capsid protein
MYAREFLKRSLDTSNGFISSDSEATKVNPQIWERILRDYEEQKLVLTPLATPFDFRGAGSTYTVTVDEAPSAAAETAETTDVSISSVSFRQVTFNPVEQSKAFQVTRAQMARGFFNAMENFSKKLGYAMAMRKDNLCRDEIYDNAGNEVIVNGVSAASDIASSDTLNYDAILEALKDNEEDLYFNHKYLVVSPQQKQQLLALGTINKANEFGTRSAIQSGVIGELFGVQVVMASNITTATAGSATYGRAIVLSESASGEQAVGYAIKRDAMIETEYHARGRYWDIVGHEEYDFKMLHDDAACLILTYQK